MKHFSQFVLVAASACAAVTGAQAQAVKSLKVELLVYSGRPNPTFVITDPQEISELLGTANGLPQNNQTDDTGASLPAPKLGYQGFVVTNNSGQNTELKSFRVHGPAVEVALAAPGLAKDKRNVSARADYRNALEAKLLARGKEQGVIDEKLNEVIESSR